MNIAITKEDHADYVPLIHVGLPFLRNMLNGYVKAEAQDGEVYVKLSGCGDAELSMGVKEAAALRDQLTAAIEELSKPTPTR